MKTKINPVPPLVRQYFEAHPGEEIKPSVLVRWVAKERGIDDQSAGSVRAAISYLVNDGLVERVSTQPLLYRWRI